MLASAANPARCRLTSIWSALCGEDARMHGAMRRGALWLVLVARVLKAGCVWRMVKAIGAMELGM